MVNRVMKAMANSMGVSNVREPRHMVASQLNTFTPVGTAISMVVYMWCAQTMKESKAMLLVA